MYADISQVSNFVNNKILRRALTNCNIANSRHNKNSPSFPHTAMAHEPTAAGVTNTRTSDPGCWPGIIGHPKSLAFKSGSITTQVRQPKKRCS